MQSHVKAIQKKHPLQNLPKSCFLTSRWLNGPYTKRFVREQCLRMILLKLQVNSALKDWNMSTDCILMS